MKETKAAITALLEKPTSELTLGRFAYDTIQKQYLHIIKQEKPVLADKDPEYLHQMRVGSRRLYTALQVFEGVVQLPKAAQLARVRSLTRVLGNLRDLDVQIASLQDNYLPQVTQKSEQRSLIEVLDRLHQRRKKAFAETKEVLTASRYLDLKKAYESWFAQPTCTLIANLPLLLVLPDLLSPLLSELLLHPGWLIPVNELSPDNVHTLHDLRKACKHARYQTDFFLPFYGEDFKTWMKEVKTLQENLGQLQDTEVLRLLLQELAPPDCKMKDLNHMIQQQRHQALENWETVRQKYLDAKYRDYLRHLLLTLQAPPAPQST